MTAGKRAYSSELRSEQARRTRRQIVLAAGELFAERGYAATTIDAVAARAGVSRKTVFSAVGGKVTLVKLAYDWAVSGDDEEIAMRDRPQVQALREMPDPARMLEAYASMLTTAMARVAPVYMAIRAAADVDPQASEVFRQVLAERRRGMAEPAELMHKRGQLRAGLSVERARDLLWFYIDPAHYAVLVGDCGWPPGDYTAWIASSLQLHLLGHP
jgi:AcrR family transcriptional regulator